MAYSLSPWLKPRFFITGTNRPLAGGLMYTYKAGTTENATTYSDDAGTTNTNPIVLDSDGQCDLYLDDAVSYRIILKNAAGVTQFDKDRIASLGSTQVQSFNSIAALRLRSGTSSANAAKTLGYYSAGDGGANSFYWDSTSVLVDNGGTVIKPTSVSGAGRWLAVDSDVVHVRQFGARCSELYDDKSKLQAAINTGKRVDISNSNVYIASTITCLAISKIDIFGNGSLLSSINAHSTFSGAYLIDASVRYSFSGLSINGNRVLGQHGIGCNTVGTSGGSVKFDDVRFYHHDIAINFGEEFEHQLGLSANKLYIQDTINGGINIGGITGAASSGESCYAFTGGTIVTNNGSLSEEYAITVTTNTPSSTKDTITVTSGNSPYYGYIYLRSSDGVNWSVPPNWSSENYTSTTFVATKVALESWQYKAVRATIGVNIRRAKSVTFDNLQAEYYGIGLLTKNVYSLNVGAFYTEARSSSPVRPNFAGVYLHTTTASSINSVWAEGYGYGIFVSNNSTSYINGVNARDCAYAAIGDTGSTDQYYQYSNVAKSGTTPLIQTSPLAGSNDYNYAGTEYTASSLLNKISHSTNPAYLLMFRGVEKSRLEYDNTNGARINLSSARISPFSKTTISPTNQSNSALFTALTSGVATSFLNITIPNNESVYAEFGYVIRLADAGLVARQTIAGSLRVSGVSAAGTCAVSVTSNDVISAQSGGTPTIAFTATVSTNVITVLANVGTVMTGPLRIYLSANTYCSSDSTSASITQL